MCYSFSCDGKRRASRYEVWGEVSKYGDYEGLRGKGIVYAVVSLVKICSRVEEDRYCGGGSLKGTFLQAFFIRL